MFYSYEGEDGGKWAKHIGTVACMVQIFFTLKYTVPFCSGTSFYIWIVIKIRLNQCSWKSDIGKLYIYVFFFEEVSGCKSFSERSYWHIILFCFVLSDGTQRRAFALVPE